MTEKVKISSHPHSHLHTLNDLLVVLLRVLDTIVVRLAPAIEFDLVVSGHSGFSSHHLDILRLFLYSVAF